MGEGGGEACRLYGGMTMEFQRFSIGARFVISGSVQDTAARAWSLLFDFLSPKEVAGLQLYGVYQEPNEIEREPAYICVLSRASLRRCKQVYARLAANPMIRSYLTLYRPFLQNNRLSVFDGYESLGRVDEAGFAVGGTSVYGNMRFVGKESEIDPLAVEAPVFLLAPDMYCGQLTSEQVIRELMRIAYSYFPYAEIVPYPIACGATGMIKALIHALGGRYVCCKIPGEDGETTLAHYGILPDHTAVIEGETAERAKLILLEAKADGYAAFVVGIGEPLTEERLRLFSPELDGRLANAQIHLFDNIVGISKFLDYAAFDQYVQQASLVITGDGETVHPRDTVEEIERRCKQYNTQVAVLDSIDPKPQTPEVALMILRNSANYLFRLLRMGNRLQRK